MSFSSQLAFSFFNKLPRSVKETGSFKFRLNKWKIYIRGVIQKKRKDKKPQGSHCIYKHSGKGKNSNHSDHQCKLHLQTLSSLSQLCSEVKKEYCPLLLSSWSCSTRRQFFFNGLAFCSKRILISVVEWGKKLLMTRKLKAFVSESERFFSMSGNCSLFCFVLFNGSLACSDLNILFPITVHLKTWMLLKN